MKSERIPTSVQPSDQESDDSINLFQVIAALGRHKILIVGLSSAAALISGLQAATLKPVWEGQFQIVLEERLSDDLGRLGQIATNNPALGSIVGLSSVGSSKIETEVKILESPSVLKPTYDFIKSSKAKSGINVDNWTFRKWRESNLDIALEKGTSILNISYRDTDRDFILPVIKRISEDYQRYSGRDRSQSITQGLSFVKQQVDQFRRQAEISSRALDTYSIRYGIPTSGNPIIGSDRSSSRSVSESVSESASEVGSVGNKGDALGQLAFINQELIRRQQKFTSKDPGVLALMRERDALRRYIEVTAGGFLTLPDQQPASKVKAQEIMLRFQELNRKAKRDVATLNSLEGSLLSLQIEQARQTDPWELISTPTLLEKPVGPHKKRMVTTGFISGLLLGCGLALILDRNSGLVFREEELLTSLPAPLLKRLVLEQTDSLIMACELLAKGPLLNAQTIALIPVGQPDSKGLKAVAKTLQLALKDRTLLLSNDLLKTRDCDTQLLLVQPGKCNRSGLAQLEQSLALQGTNVAGWLLLDTTRKML